MQFVVEPSGAPVGNHVPVAPPAVALFVVGMGLYLVGAGLGWLPVAEQAGPAGLLIGGTVVTAIGLGLITWRQGLRIDPDRGVATRVLRVTGVRFQQTCELRRVRAVAVQERDNFYLSPWYYQDRWRQCVLLDRGRGDGFVLARFTLREDAERVAEIVADRLGVDRRRPSGPRAGGPRESPRRRVFAEDRVAHSRERGGRTEA